MNEEIVDSSLEGMQKMLVGRKTDAEKAKGTGNVATKVQLSLLTLSFFILSPSFLSSFPESSFFSKNFILIFEFFEKQKSFISSPFSRIKSGKRSKIIRIVSSKKWQDLHKIHP